MRNLITIPQGVSFSRTVCAKLRIKNVYSASLFWFFQWPTAEASEPIFTQNTSNDVVRARMCRCALLGL